MNTGMTTRAVKRSVKRSTMPEVAPEFRFTTKDVERLSERLGEPDWLRDIRLNAWQTYSDLPMPSTRDEAWRRSDIRLLPADRLGLDPEVNISADDALRADTEIEQGSHQLILHPEGGTEITGGEALAEQGVIFCDWKTAFDKHGDLLREHLGSVVRAEDGKFAALAAGVAHDGVFVYVPPDTRIEKPLRTVFWSPVSGSVAATRLLIIVDAGAEITLLHEMISPTLPDGETVNAGIVEISVADDARLTFIELQDLGRHVWNFTHERARLGRNASLNWVLGSVGSRFTKSFVDLDLNGEGAQARLSGFYVADGSQHLDHDTQQNHLAAHTTSDLLFKGALTERSRSVWQGMIYVAPGAQRTDGYQVNRNLILSEDARADSIPGLEILADDVRCTHGATVGRLEEETLFYLMSRGIQRDMAEKLLIDGFFAPIMEQITIESARAHFAGLVESKLG